MGKTSAANVIDLDSFRQRKLSAKAESPTMPTPQAALAGYPAMMMPVWFWVPVWAPVVP